MSPWTFGADVLVGSVVVGGALALMLAAATIATGGRRRTIRCFCCGSARAIRICTAASRRGNSRAASCAVTRCIARSSTRSALPSGISIVDVGCGQGLALSVLTEASRLHDEGRWPLPQPPPRIDSAIGIELRPRVARIAKSGARRPRDDRRDRRPGPSLPACDAVLLLDVLHMLAAEEQERLLASVSAAVRPGGVLLVREADAEAGWTFGMVRLGNRLKALRSAVGGSIFTSEPGTSGPHAASPRIHGLGASGQQRNALRQPAPQRGQAGR